jgi:DNA-binding MarR family transcriptional regulator
LTFSLNRWNVNVEITMICPMTRAIAHPRSTIPHQRRDSRYPYWFARISRALSQHLLLHVEARFGLNLAEYRTLNTLAELSSTSIRDIAADASLDKAQVSRAVAALTARGLVVQVVDGTDRRLRVVKLTPAGEALIAETLPFVTERQQQLEQNLSEAERRALWSALTSISKAAERLLAQEQKSTAQRKMLSDTVSTTRERSPESEDENPANNIHQD